MENNVHFYCCDALQKKICKDYATDYEKHGPLGMEIIANGIIHPWQKEKHLSRGAQNYGGVFDANGVFLTSSSPARPQGEAALPRVEWLIGANPLEDFSNVNYIDEDVIYIGPAIKHIAHFYLEIFCRCWPLLETSMANKKIAYLTLPESRGLSELYLEFFDLIDVKRENLIEVTSLTQFKSVVIPEQSFEHEGKYHKLYKALFDKMKSKVEAKNYKKVYFSKKKNAHPLNLHVNWDAMDDFYTKNGFEVFYPENLSIKETISILNGCEEFVAQSGSNSLNSIFLNDRAHVTILSRSEHVHNCQSNFSKLRNFTTTYVAVYYPHIKVPHDLGPFAFLCTDYFLEYAKQNGLIYNFKNLIKRNDSVVNELLCKYAKIYSEEAFTNYLNVISFTARDLCTLLSELECIKPKKNKFKFIKKIKEGKARTLVIFNCIKIKYR